MTSPPIHNLNVLEQELGALRLRCEVPPKKTDWFDIIVGGVVLFFLAFIPAGLLVAMPLKLLNAPLSVIRVATLSFALLIDVLIMRAIVKHVSKDYLCLFEEGFASRVGAARRRFRFDEIERIGFGQQLTKLERKLQGIGYVLYVAKPSLKSIHDEAARNMITVMLKSGKRQFVKGVLNRFDTGQTREFFRILMDEYPELWEPLGEE
jgi:hypothetical protein